MELKGCLFYNIYVHSFVENMMEAICLVVNKRTNRSENQELMMLNKGLHNKIGLNVSS